MLGFFGNAGDRAEIIFEGVVADTFGVDHSGRFEVEAIFVSDIVDEDGGELAVDTETGFGVGDGQVVEELVAGPVFEQLGGGFATLENNVLFEAVVVDGIDDVGVGEGVGPGDLVAAVGGRPLVAVFAGGVGEDEADGTGGDGELAAGDGWLVDGGKKHGEAVDAVLVFQGKAGRFGGGGEVVADFGGEKSGQPAGGTKKAESLVKKVEAEN